MTSIDRKVALVTGASGGIGSAIATALEAGGATVRRADLDGTGADMVLDVTDVAMVETVVGETVATHGRLDIVVTAAGVAVGGPMESVPLEEWQRVIDVNLWGTIHVIRAAYPVMIRQTGGHLALIASLSGLVGSPLLVPYSATKSAVVAIAAGLRPEATRHGIGVTAICPGPVDTRMLDDGGFRGALHGIDARRYLSNAVGPPIAPERLAEATVRGITRNTAVVAPGRARLLHLGARLSPGVTERILGWRMRSELRSG